MPRTGSDTQILVFAKAPEPGAVKTRLVPLLGEARAAALHAELAAHALATARGAGVGAVCLYCAPDTTHPFFRHCASAYGVALMAQGNGDLGERMSSAFGQALQHAAHVILIGTDCPALTAAHLRGAQQALAAGYNAVIAPAEDGGYALIGLNDCTTELFRGITWGGPMVMEDTRGRLRALGRSWRELETVWDVDRPADYERLQQSGLLAEVRAPAVHGTPRNFDGRTR